MVIEVKYPVLMAKEDLDDLIKKMDTLESAFYALEGAWLAAPDEIQDILNDVGNFPFGCSLGDAGADYGGWNSRAQEALLETICQSCKRAVYIGRGENYQFDEKKGYDVCNECFEKKEGADEKNDSGTKS